jgi:GGDEF domain-containing protein
LHGLVGLACVFFDMFFFNCFKHSGASVASPMPRVFLRYLSCVCVALGLQVWALPAAQAVPSLDLSSQEPTRLNTDLQKHWQRTQVRAPGLGQADTVDASAVWSWPDSQFATGSTEAVNLKAGESLVGRVALQVAPSLQGLVLTLPMTRLDRATLSYRYDGGPWVQAASGDQVPMQQWPISHTSPAFAVPAQSGKLQLVLHITHQGWVATPVLVQSAAVFRDERFKFSLLSGALLGLTVVMSLLSFGCAFIFKRFSFVAVALMTVVVGLLTASQTGVLGMYFGTDSARFNDLSKFVTGMLCGALMPWVVATVASQKSYAVWVWRLALVWLAMGMGLIIFQISGSLQDMRAAILPPYLLCSMLVVTGIALASALRKQAHAKWILLAVVFDGLSILLPLARHVGLTDGALALVVASMGFLASTLLLFYTQLLQYRQGRMVMSRAQSSDHRDALTGLLNRRGFEKVLSVHAQQMVDHKTYAAFFYIQVSDAESSRRNYGDESYDAGVLQMAAAVSFGVSAVDVVARVASNGFVVMVVMPRNAAQATALAQKIIIRAMGIASHGLQVAQTTRIAIAWLPLFGKDLTVLERRAIHVFSTLEPGKRIGWIGGAYAHLDQSEMPGGEVPDSVSPAISGLPPSNLQETIRRLEREAFDPETETSELLAQRKMRTEPGAPASM